MDAPSSTVRELARRLLATEAAKQSPDDSCAHEVVRVFEKLRVSLTRFAGADGFAALLRRALTLAQVEAPTLQRITVKADGSMEGLDVAAAEAGDSGTQGNATVAITAHLLGLLVIFIGEPLTVRLVREAWPDAELGEEP